MHIEVEIQGSEDVTDGLSSALLPPPKDAVEQPVREEVAPLTPHLISSPSVAIWTKEDIGWLAGLFEGEGYIDGSHDAFCIRMTDEDVIRKVQEITGFGTVCGPYPRKQPHHKPIWAWRVYRKRQKIRFALAIYPLLGQRRRNQIAIFADRIKDVKEGSARS